MVYEKINNYKEELNEYKLKLDIYSPKNKISNLSSRLDVYNNKLNIIINDKINKLKYNYENKLNLLKTYNVLEKFDNGFSYITNIKDKKITSINSVKIGDEINIRLKDGKILTAVKKIERNIDNEK